MTGSWPSLGRYTHPQKHDHKVDNCESNGPPFLFVSGKKKMCHLRSVQLLPRSCLVMAKKCTGRAADGHTRTDELMR